MIIMTIETPDPKVFQKATDLLKKLNVKISVVHQDDNTATAELIQEKPAFEKACEGALSSQEARAETKKKLSRFFDENGKNIRLKE